MHGRLPGPRAPRRAPWRALLPTLLALLALLGSLPGAHPGSTGGLAQAGPAKGTPGVPDKKLQQAIDEAIRKGAVFLRGEQSRDGRIASVAHGKDQLYEIGATALAGLALLAAGDKAAVRKPRETDEQYQKRMGAVDKAMAFCRKKDIWRRGGKQGTTYDTGTLLMFLAEYHNPQFDKKGRRKRGRKKKKKGSPNPCGLTDEARRGAKDMARWLIAKQESVGGWGYPHYREDMSNTQYALLGLRAARDCGCLHEDRAFQRVIERVLSLQEKEGPPVLRSVGGERKGETIYKIDSGDRARGWGYLPTQVPRMSTGSMTTAGIACLAICHDALTRPKRAELYVPVMENHVRRGIQDGFAWLDLNFTVMSNPPARAPGWHYYYLYGLERAAMLAGRTRIGRHDWYLEGAKYLVTAQKEGGQWSSGALGDGTYGTNSVLDTAWAILFLKKATKPVKPIPGPVVTK